MNAKEVALTMVEALLRNVRYEWSCMRDIASLILIAGWRPNETRGPVINTVESWSWATSIVDRVTDRKKIIRLSGRKHFEWDTCSFPFFFLSFFFVVEFSSLSLFLSRSFSSRPSNLSFDKSFSFEKERCIICPAGEFNNESFDKIKKLNAKKNLDITAMDGRDIFFFFFCARYYRENVYIYR